MNKLMGVALGLLLLLTPALQAITTLDLITGNTGTAAGAIGGTFRVDWIDAHSTGTGVIDTFLSIKQNGQERGFNTSLGSPLDDNGDGHISALTLGDVPLVKLDDGIWYRQFLLDINQNGNKLLSLNQIQIFEASTDVCPASLAHCKATFGALDELKEASTSTDALIRFSVPTGDFITEVFRMNAPNLPNDDTAAGAARKEIELDFHRNEGSGSGDMFLYVRNDAFTDKNPDTNIILFSQFGSPRGLYASNDGFEEWAVVRSVTPPPSVPEPASILLFGTLLLGA